MVTNLTENKPNYVQIVDQLVCTEWGREYLKSSANSLTGRQRQFIRLLQNDDPISKTACCQIIDRVSLIELIENRILARKDNLPIIIESESDTDIITTEPNILINGVPISNDRAFVSPAIQVVSGVYQ